MQDSQRIGSAVHANSFSTVRRINRHMKKQNGLIMLFNFSIEKSDKRRNVAEALGKRASSWAKKLSDMDIIERRELVVLLIAGLSPPNRTANVLVVQFVLFIFADQGRKYIDAVSEVVSGGGDVKHSLCSISVLAFRGTLKHSTAWCFMRAHTKGIVICELYYNN